MNAEEKQTLLLLQQLSRLEPFQLWRDKVAKPLLDQWENELKRADELPEVALRANLKHMYTIKALFYDWFDSVDLQLEEEKEEKEQSNG